MSEHELHALMEHGKQDLARLILRLEAERDELQGRLENAVSHAVCNVCKPTMELNAELAGVLESVQWSFSTAPSALDGACPRCGRTRSRGHNEVCELAAALAKLEKKT